MTTLFKQFPLLLPALGIVGAASLLILFWLGLGLVSQRLHRGAPRRRSSSVGIELGSGGAYESRKSACENGSGADLGAADCGGDGGGGGGD